MSESNLTQVLYPEKNAIDEFPYSLAKNTRPHLAQPVNHIRRYFNLLIV